MGRRRRSRRMTSRSDRRVTALPANGQPDRFRRSARMFLDPRLPTRFWSKVLPVDGGCWIWIAALSDGGYGYYGIEQGRCAYAHRVAYSVLVGPIPPALDLDHLCRNRDCVNPDHLEPVTRQENTLRGLAGWHQASKTHCANGHPYDEKNTRWRADRWNSRDCRECKNAATRAWRARLRPLTDAQFDEIDKLMKESA